MEAVSVVEVINLTILKAVVEIQQDVEVDEEEGFASVAEVEVFVEGDVAADTEAREDPVIKQILEEAKEEFIENKYNQ